MISDELIEGLTRINNLILVGQLTNTARFALLLEILATAAREEAEEPDKTNWGEAEDLQSSIRIDP